MPAHPVAGQAYRQEFYPGEAEDLAEVTELGATKAVGPQEYADVLVIKEWNPLEPDVVEQKCYAPGLGMIAEETVAGGDDRRAHRDGGPAVTPPADGQHRSHAAGRRRWRRSCVSQTPAT